VFSAIHVATSCCRRLDAAAAVAGWPDGQIVCVIAMTVSVAISSSPANIMACNVHHVRSMDLINFLCKNTTAITNDFIFPPTFSLLNKNTCGSDGRHDMWPSLQFHDWEFWGISVS